MSIGKGAQVAVVMDVALKGASVQQGGSSILRPSAIFSITPCVTGAESCIKPPFVRL